MRFTYLFIFFFMASSIHHLSAQSDSKNAGELMLGINAPIGDLGNNFAETGLNVGLKYKRILLGGLGLYGKGTFTTINFDADKLYDANQGFMNPSVDPNKYTNLSLGVFYQFKPNRVGFTPFLGYVYSSLSKGTIEVSHPMLSANPQVITYDNASSSGFELGLQLSYDIKDAIYIGLEGSIWGVIHDDIKVVGDPANVTSREDSGFFQMNVSVGYRF